MKFVCQENYREFFGYVFYNGQPTDVRDKATIERCMKDRSFKPFVDTDETTVTPPSSTVSLSKYLCSKCGKEYRRGMYFHQKYCDGA